MKLFSYSQGGEVCVPILGTLDPSRQRQRLDPHEAIQNLVDASFLPNPGVMSTWHTWLFTIRYGATSRDRIGSLQCAMERKVMQRGAIVKEFRGCIIFSKPWCRVHMKLFSYSQGGEVCVPILGTLDPSLQRQRLEPASKASSFDKNTSVAGRWQGKCKEFGVADLVVYNLLWSEKSWSAVPL